MAQLSSIPGIGKTSLELLEVAGFLDVESLAHAGVEELTLELARANEILKIAKRTPKATNVEKWIHSARTLIGFHEQPEEEVVMPVNYEGNPQVLEMLEEAPLAVPFPARQLVEHGVGVADIPTAIFLNRYSGDLEVRIKGMVPAVEEKPPISQEAKNSLPRLKSDLLSPAVTGFVGIDLSRVRSTAEMTSEGVKVPVTFDTQDRLSVLRAPLEKTNRGKNPDSRNYIRGVLHTHPVSMWFAAVITLLLFTVAPAAIISAGLLLLSDQMPEHFQWVPKWLLAFPIALPVVAIFYAIWAQGGSCRICRQRLFWPRHCIKNSKAHHVPGFGYIVPLCLHILLFRWFRCSYCGTPVRLKK